MYKDNDKKRIRIEDEKSNVGRTPFRRDYGRLLHSPSFRRLQGKTQLFPNDESDFFRNRLTHSLEVAQIAKGIAQYLNETKKILAENYAKIDVDLVEFAGLAHDLGHPPFGHNGEKALDECMKSFGGFEGNAQTLRILTKVERKVYAEGLPPTFIHGIGEDGQDARLGLNLTYRSLASILKYDKEIAEKRGPLDKLEKGYYSSERDVVREIKNNVAPGLDGRFKTIECQIMDIADDIAYSTYDLEDAMKAGFLSPLEMVSRVSQPEFARMLAEKIDETIPGVSDKDAVNAIVEVLNFDDSDLLATYQGSCMISENSHARTRLSSGLVHNFMMGIDLIPADNMAVAEIKVASDVRLKIEALKHFNYLSIIMSPRMKVVEYRGGDIVKKLFEAFSSGSAGRHLLPPDVQVILKLVKSEQDERRVICDFVAGMTDRYAVNFYNRLFGSAASLFVPI